MRLEIASKKAVKYACSKFHYTKKAPMVQIAFNVYEDDIWCGVICYSIGANNKMGVFLDLKLGEVIELVRVALNGKQKQTSKCLAISIKLIKKYCPLVKAIVSYSDITWQKHLGIIYQATNWYYIDIVRHKHFINRKGERVHNKTSYEMSKERIIAELTKTDWQYKHKYCFPLNNNIRIKLEKLKKPYPKICVNSVINNTTHSNE